MNNVRELRLNVDENNLLHEWKGQAQMMLEYGIKLADAMQEEDEARAGFDVCKAKLEQEIRANPDQFDVMKVTETSIAAAVLAQPEYEASRKKRDTARHEVALCRAAVDALAHRKSTLQGMTDLFMRQWYADPKSPAQPEVLRDEVTKVISRRRVRHPE